MSKTDYFEWDGTLDVLLCDMEAASHVIGGVELCVATGASIIGRLWKHQRNRQQPTPESGV